eukprot:TRINITY_DN2540_c0_g1_i11.p1 TRINITY_DN2540_c0_g1~~TRINITY_DN2540_c0_g1_i11.p1  ORF type:complete len:119 (+),score=22.17 TRINITY_DN2540_c0_g1_i11:113-469(+)
MKIGEDIGLSFKKTEGVKRDWSLKADTLVWTEGAGDGTKPPESTTPSSSAILQLLERKVYQDVKEGGEEGQITIRYVFKSIKSGEITLKFEFGDASPLTFKIVVSTDVATTPATSPTK